MLLIELNEFNPAFMEKVARDLQAPHLLRLLSLPHSRTHTDEQDERYGLDPWVQWVSVHTGQPATRHGVRHLADLSQLAHPQLWETLGERGLTTGVWGAMNASGANARGMQFFFPDPWSFEQKAQPPCLNELLALPAYYAKNYGDLKLLPLASTGAALLKFVLRPSIFRALLPIAPKVLLTLCRHGFSDHVLFALFDLVNATLFAHFHKKYQPDCAIVFFNSLAHFQHHKWFSANEVSAEAQVVYGLMDAALGKVFSLCDGGRPFLVANAFSQECSYDRREFLYRQKNPAAFLQATGIAFARVEQLMTNDGHVFFDSPEQALVAKNILEQVRLQQQPLFHVDWQENAPQRLFFQVSFWGDIPPGTVFFINGRSLSFFDCFDRVTRRSGSHVPAGDVFASGLQLPGVFYNHELFDCVLQALQAKTGESK